MRLLLHIGSHKTGTTAIQRWAANHRDLLRNHGLLYPDFRMIGIATRPNHLSLISGMYGLGDPREDLTPTQVSEYLDRVNTMALARDSEVLLSGENVFRLKARQRDDLYARLRQVFRTFDVVPVLTLRRQDELADSLYRTVVRGEERPTRRPPTWQEFLDSSAALFDYAGIERQAAQRCGTGPIVVGYAGELRANAVPGFFERLGYHLPATAGQRQKRNVSFDYLDCVVKLRLHDCGAPPEVFQALERFVAAHPVRSGRSFFGVAERKEFLARFEEENADLVRRYPDLEAAFRREAPSADEVPAAEPVSDRLEQFRAFVNAGMREHVPA